MNRHINGMEIYYNQDLNQACNSYYKDERLVLKLNPRHVTIPTNAVYMSRLVYVHIDCDIDSRVDVKISIFRHCSRLKNMSLRRVNIVDEEIVFSDSLEYLELVDVYVNSAGLVNALPTTLHNLSLIGDERDDMVYNLTDIGRVTSLKNLELRSMYIRLPDTLDGLSQLTSLIIEYCNIRTTPSLSALTSLKKLVIRYCPLMNRVHDSLYTLSQIEWIEICYCCLSLSIDLDRLCDITSLIYLELSCNDIECSLPSIDSVSKLTNLIHLFLDSNRISGTVSDEWIECMPNIESITLSNNKQLSGTVSSKYNGMLRVQDTEVKVDIN